MRSIALWTLGYPGKLKVWVGYEYLLASLAGYLDGFVLLDVQRSTAEATVDDCMASEDALSSIGPAILLPPSIQLRCLPVVPFQSFSRTTSPVSGVLKATTVRYENQRVTFPTVTSIALARPWPEYSPYGLMLTLTICSPAHREQKRKQKEPSQQSQIPGINRRSRIDWLGKGFISPLRGERGGYSELDGFGNRS